MHSFIITIEKFDENALACFPDASFQRRLGIVLGRAGNLNQIRTARKSLIRCFSNLY